MTIHPVILSGGSGVRLWPLSRSAYPKQFLSLMTEQTMLQETIYRLDGLEDVAEPVIVCNEEHRFMVAEQTREIEQKPSSIILEPVGRNTAPAITLAAHALLQSSPDSEVDPVMLVMPADHVIRNGAAFRDAVRKGSSLATDGHLVTFGIVPSSPHTGYGYIKKGDVVEDEQDQVFTPHIVSEFIEKPDVATAKTFVESEDYLWNSGIFIMKASVWLGQLALYRPDIAEACQEAFAHAAMDQDFCRPNADIFSTCPSESIDYAVMEPASVALRDSQHLGNGTQGCVVIPLDVGWSDIGSWTALWEESDQDTHGNVVQGDVYAYDVQNSLLFGQHRLLAAVGVEDVVVVETPDAVLVTHKNRVQDIKKIVEQLKSEGRIEQEFHSKVGRPWGNYEAVDSGGRYQVKRLTVNPGAALSLQMHHHRAEHWVVVRGTAKVTRGEEQFLLTENESAYVPVGVVHRLENPGSIPLEIIEVQSGGYLGEDDIVRLEDRYNRHRS